MVRTNLTLFIWGLVAVVIDVNVETIDVLFDPIAFGVVAAALFSLAPLERNFAIAARFALGAIVASIAALAFPEPWSLISLAGTALQFFVLWYVCTGVMRLAASQGKLHLFELATQRRTLNFFASAVGLAVIGIVRVVPETAPVLAVLAVGFGIVVLALTLLMLRQASRELAP